MDCNNSNLPSQQQSQRSKENKSAIEQNDKLLITQNQIRRQNINVSWAELKISGTIISRRSYHSMSYYKGSIVVYGGYEQEAGILNDFQQLKIQNVDQYEWKKIQISSTNQITPGYLRRHTSIIYKDKLYIFGGQNGTTQNNNDMYSFDFNKKKWATINYKKNNQTPPMIDSHGCVLINEESEQNAQMIILCGFQGGQNASYTNAVYSYSFYENTWKLLSKNDPQNPQFPQPRGGAAFSIHQNKIYLFGGCTSDKKFNSLWNFDLNNLKWQQIESSNDIVPTGRSGHSMVTYNNCLFVFGGISEVTKEKNDIYMFSIESQQWKIIEENTNLLQNLPKQKQSERKNISPRRNLNSPTRYNRDRINSVKRKSEKDMGVSPIRQTIKKQEDIMQTQCYNPSNEQQNQTNASYQPVNFIDEKKKQQLLIEKQKMLEDLQLNIWDKKYGERQDSPTTKSMKDSLLKVGNQGKSKQVYINLMSESAKQKEQDEINAYEDSNFYIEKHCLIGKKPCGRDGQGCILQEDGKIVIFGGDRHLMSFNDTYTYDLLKAIIKE